MTPVCRPGRKMTQVGDVQDRPSTYGGPVPGGQGTLRQSRVIWVALLVALELAGLSPAPAASHDRRTTSQVTHRSYVVHLDRDTALPAGDSLRPSDRSIRSWPGKKIRYWTHLSKS